MDYVASESGLTVNTVPRVTDYNGEPTDALDTVDITTAYPGPNAYQEGIVLTSSFFVTTYGAMVAKTTESKDMFAFVRPFGSDLWYGTLGFLTIAAACTIVLQSMKATGDEHEAKATWAEEFKSTMVDKGLSAEEAEEQLQEAKHLRQKENTMWETLASLVHRAWQATYESLDTFLGGAGSEALEDQEGEYAVKIFRISMGLFVVSSLFVAMGLFRVGLGKG